MTKNIDMTGRILRLLVAIALLVGAWWQGSWLLLLAALFVFFEAWMSWCVVYQLLGINSCPIEERPKKE